MLVAIGGGQPRALLGNQETHIVASTDDIKPHHVGEFVGAALGPIIPKPGQGAAPVERPQPRVQQIALLDGPDDRGVGASKIQGCNPSR
jgi:hypothetical protein